MSSDDGAVAQSVDFTGIGEALGTDYFHIRDELTAAEVGIDLSQMLHVGQDFRWSEPVCAGDVITTETSLADVQEARGVRPTPPSRRPATTAARRRSTPPGR